MATVSDLVTYQLAQTEADLQSPDGLANFGAIKTSSIDRAKAEFYLTAAVPDESSISDIVKFHLSDVAVLYLIDVAIDWYQSKTVLAHTQDDETLRFYDRIQNLKSQRRELQHRTAKALPTIKSIAFGSADIGDVASLPLTTMQQEKRDKVTKEPWQWARFLYGDYIEIAEGIEPRTVLVDRPG